MRILDAIRRNPVATLGVVVAGIGGWIVAELVAPPPPPRPAPMPPPGALLAAETPPLPPSPGVPAAALAVLPKLKPGMTRGEVEGLLGPPAHDAVQPVTLTDGQLRYRASYDLGEPEPPPTIRPIRRSRLPDPPRESSGIHVALEFDASKPGHPLVEVLYLDPLF